LIAPYRHEVRHCYTRTSATFATFATIPPCSATASQIPRVMALLPSPGPWCGIYDDFSWILMIIQIPYDATTTALLSYLFVRDNMSWSTNTNLCLIYYRFEVEKCYRAASDLLQAIIE
jgi:hypothetical protein